LGHLPPDVWRGGDLNALSYCVPPNASCTTPTSIDGESRFSQFPPLKNSDRRRTRMKAIVIHHYGPPDVLKYENVPDPEPRAGEIRIRIHAATANRVLDVSLRAGNERARAPVLPLIPGVDCAGVVDALGAGVTRWRPGMRVAAAGVMPLDICREDDDDYAGPTGMMGIKRPGGFAEMVAVPACAAIELPD